MTTIEIPPFMRHRPVDERRGLPIPWMNQRDDGSHDFITVKEEKRRRAARKSLCGICGRKLRHLSAFVGGPMSANSHYYSNPSYHPECAEWAMGVCPFIVIERHSRVSDRRAAEALAHTPSAMELGKPSIWILGVAKTADTKTEFIQGEMHFLAGPWVRREAFTYVDGKLTRKVG